jgi:hypothetical protein
MTIGKSFICAFENCRFEICRKRRAGHLSSWVFAAQHRPVSLFLHRPHAIPLSNRN